MTMLETTLSTKYSPSANLKGQVAGASWLFLLPSLPLERALCIGMPSRATLTSLASLCREVVVLGRTPQGVLEGPWQAELDNVDWGALSPQTLLQWSDASVDLALLVDRQHAAQYARETWLQQQVRRLLKAEGWIHYEYYADSDPLHALCSADQTRLWMTPLSGEAATIVPLSDRETIAYFTEHALYSPSFQMLPSLKRLARALKPGKKTPQPSQPPLRNGANGASKTPDTLPATAAATPPRKATGGASLPGKSALRATGTWVLNTLDMAGSAVERYALRTALLRRTAVLSGPGAGRLAEHPPAYLRRLAAEEGIELDHYAWGMVAPADYSSRKLIHFLFDRAQRGPGQQRPLDYIVKMVRNPGWNARLENERRALTLLQASSIQDHDAIPRVVFSGYHAGLVLVGESAIEGVPFRSRSQGDADCPYLRRALDWLTDLASATAARQVSNGQAATVLHGLLEQFLQFYQMTPEHRTFLSGQIERIAAATAPLPTVFQHGDPGLWNLLVTPSGQVAFLDWEAAETAGMPLWDFFHLLRSYSVHAARRRGVQDSLQAVQQLLGDTPLRRAMAAAIGRYGEAVQLPDELIQPMFYTCWMHRAIKEASRLPTAQLDRGHYVNLLRLCIDQRHAVTSALLPRV